MKNLLSFLTLFLLTIISCEKSTDPNTIGGSTDIPLSKVGNEFGIFFDVGDSKLNFALQSIEDSVVITKNENGLVNFNVN